MQLFRNHNGADFVKNFSGIDLSDVNDPDTLCPDLETVKRLHGWHYRLTESAWPIPLEQICDRITKRLPRK